MPLAGRGGEAGGNRAGTSAYHFEKNFIFWEVTTIPSAHLDFSHIEDIPIDSWIGRHRAGESMGIQKVDFLRGKELDAVIVKRLLTEERDDHLKRQKHVHEKHQMIRFQISRGMSRARAELTWGREMVTSALDSEGIQTCERSVAIAAE